MRHPTETCRRRRRRLSTAVLFLAAVVLAPGRAGSAGTAAAIDLTRLPRSPGAEAYYHFSMAKLAQQRQDFGAAVSFLKEAAKVDPGSAVIRAELAATFLRVRDYPAAEQAAREALDLDSGNGLAHRVLAQLYYSRARRGMDAEENTRRAMEELEASMSGDERDDPDTLLTLGRFYYDSGEYQKSVESLRRFAEVQANPSPSSLFLLSRALMQLELYDDAEQVLRQILSAAPDWLQVLEMLVRVTRVQGEFEETIEPLQRILQIQGGDAATYNQLGDAYFRTGRYTEAVEMFEMASRENPKSPYSLYYLGLSQERLEHLPEARETFTRLLESDPENVDVLFRLARLDEREGANRSAIAHYRRLVAALEKIEDRSDPRRRDIDTFCGRVGVLLLEAGRYDDAVSQVSRCMERSREAAASLHLLMVRTLLFDGKGEKALGQARRSARIFPDQPRFLTLEAEVMLQIGRERQAEERLAALLDRAPVAGDDDSTGADPGVEGSQDDGVVRMPVFVSDAYFNAGALAERRGDLERAERFLAKAIEINPENGPALNYLGYLWADAGRKLDAAIDLLHRAIALDPDNGAYLDSLGWAYYRVGRHEEARKQLRKAIERMGADPTIQEHLGDLEAATGNLGAAVEYWRRALELAPDEPEALQEKIRQHRKDE